MNNEPCSIPALIDQWPTIAEFAADLGCGYEAARQMRLRKSIAPAHWPKLIKASADRGIQGVTLDWLVAQRASQVEAAQ